ENQIQTELRIKRDKQINGTMRQDLYQPVSTQPTCQIFWPEHCLNLGQRRGYLIGWNTAALKCLVMTVITVDEDTGAPTTEQVERALCLLALDPRAQPVNDFCSAGGGGSIRGGKAPTILGEWLPGGAHRGAEGRGSSSPAPVPSGPTVSAVPS
ncbi:unnamed protein product, partial [Discosporangium mesarthrocarpum]